MYTWRSCVGAGLLLKSGIDLRTFVWPAQFPYCLILKKKTKKKTNNRDRHETAGVQSRRDWITAIRPGC